MRHERCFCALCETHDGLRCRDVLGQVKVMAARVFSRGRDLDGEVIRQRVDDRIVAFDRVFQCAGVVGIDNDGVELEMSQLVE